MSDEAEKKRVRWQCPRCRKNYMVPQGKVIGQVCPTCQEQIATEFPVIVPATVTRLPRRRKSNPLPWIVAAMVACILVAIPVVWYAMQSEPEKPAQEIVQEDPVIAARNRVIDRARLLVLEHLKVPDSAIFEDVDEFQKTGGDKSLSCRVIGIVRSKNAIGVMIRNRWTVDFDKKGDLELITLGDEFVFVSDNLQKTFDEFERAVGNSGERLSEKIEAEVKRVRVVALTAISKLESRDYQSRWIDDVTRTDLRIRKVDDNWLVDGEIRPYDSKIWTPVEFKISHPDLRVIAGRVGRKNYKTE